MLGRGYKGGQEASGGEWQMLGIARALYRRPEILVVDEPTSALDAVAEQRVFDQIRALAAAGQTVVLITHRLHSVRHADVIHVMKDGQVAESGTFSELMDESTGTGNSAAPIWSRPPRSRTACPPSGPPQRISRRT